MSTNVTMNTTFNLLDTSQHHREGFISLSLTIFVLPVLSSVLSRQLHERAKIGKQQASL